MKKHFCDICGKETIYDAGIGGQMRIVGSERRFPDTDTSDTCKACAEELFDLLDKFIRDTRKK